jgi:tRNA A37 N6-isopentenylltransferase MiaA
MITAGYVSQTGKLNVLVVDVIRKRTGKLAGSFVFTTQYELEEAKREAINLQTVVDGNTYQEFTCAVAEHEVLDKDVDEETPRGTHKQFVDEIHGVVALWRNAIHRRFGYGNGQWFAIFNGPVSIAQNDLIEQSRLIP